MMIDVLFVKEQVILVATALAHSCDEFSNFAQDCY